VKVITYEPGQGLQNETSCKRKLRRLLNEREEFLHLPSDMRILVQHAVIFKPRCQAHQDTILGRPQLAFSPFIDFLNRDSVWRWKFIASHEHREDFICGGEGPECEEEHISEGFVLLSIYSMISMRAKKKINVEFTGEFTSQLFDQCPKSPEFNAPIKLNLELLLRVLGFQIPRWRRRCGLALDKLESIIIPSEIPDLLRSGVSRYKDNFVGGIRLVRHVGGYGLVDWRQSRWCRYTF
jgi:hypothetical protein